MRRKRYTLSMVLPQLTTNPVADALQKQPGYTTLDPFVLTLLVSEEGDVTPEGDIDAAAMQQRRQFLLHWRGHLIAQSEVL